MSFDALVLGAGIQGVCVALMLRQSGKRVALIDMASDVMTRASLTYEGKVHMGFIWGMDRTFATAQRMMQDALHFASHIDDLTGRAIDWPALTSTRNLYLVHRESLMSPDQVEGHFEKVQACYDTLKAHPGAHYLGRRPKQLFASVKRPDYLNPTEIQAAFQTEEASVDQVRLRDILRASLMEDPGITRMLNHRVERIALEDRASIVTLSDAQGNRQQIGAPLVINCLWENRRKFDVSVGITDIPDYTTRFKYGIVLEANDYIKSLDSITIIQGPFGNFVVDPAREGAYASWYPACIKGSTTSDAIPLEWDQACGQDAPPCIAAAIGRDNLDAFRKILPDLPDVAILRAKAGLIPAEGTSDIDTKDSRFHTRAEDTFLSKGCYTSVNTGKYTSAPRNAIRLRDHLVAQGQL
ncbi:MAG: FAD-dependent oxidoreductase [Pseudomonadota bacterium]